MRMLFALVAVAVLTASAYAGAAVGLTSLLGHAVPYAALSLLVVGLIYRVVHWARSPVPFNITTTCGQQKSLPWIHRSRLENPSSLWGVAARMALEILFFRSLFRNTRAELDAARSSKVVYASAYGLWFFSLLFHWSLLVVLLRHMRLFLAPVPAWVLGLQRLDGFFEVGLPVLYLTGVTLTAGLAFLLLRRLVSSRLRYISLAADYFPLFLILAIAVTGILLRYVVKTDVVDIKESMMGLVRFRPVIREEIHPLFYAHLFLASSLMAYLPFSKLVHGAGVFFSPTRNMTGSSREVRHVNPWNDPSIGPHSYEAYEDEFREKMKAAGIPVDKE